MPRQESKLGKDNDEGAGDRKPKGRSVLKGREGGAGKKRRKVREHPADGRAARRLRRVAGGRGTCAGFFGQKPPIRRAVRKAPDCMGKRRPFQKMKKPEPHLRTQAGRWAAFLP
nr:hypothetical protein [Bacillaceae bacterium]